MRVARIWFSASTTRRRRRRAASQRIRPAIQHVLDAITGAPALVRNGRLDYLAANSLGRALYAPLFESPAGPPNSARFVFLDPGHPISTGTGTGAASDIVAILRTQACRTPYDKGLSDLIGELSTRSETFRTQWAAHNVRLHQTGTKQFTTVVGDLDLAWDAWTCPPTPADLT